MPTQAPRPNNAEYYEMACKILDAYDEGTTNRTELARLTGYSRPQVIRVLKNHRENREMIIQRERQVWDMRQKGKTHAQIAAALDVDRSTVTKMLGRMYARSLSNLDEAVKQEKLEQWDRLDYMVSECLDAWEKSKQAAKSVTEKKIMPAPDPNAPAPAGQNQPNQPAERVTTSQVTDQDGNVRFLVEARAALADIRKILGIDAPTKIAATNPQGDEAAPGAGQVIVYIPDNNRQTAANE